MAKFKASAKFRENIKRLEGFRSEAYDDADGKSIGYGFQNKEFLDAKYMDREQADQALEVVIGQVEKEAEKMITVDHQFTQNQQDVILDMFYNLRPSARKGSIELLNKKQFDEFYQNIAALVKARKQNPKTKKWELVVNQGLVDRAKFRQNLWLEPDTPEDIERQKKLAEAPDVSDLEPNLLRDIKEGESRPVEASKAQPKTQKEDERTSTLSSVSDADLDEAVSEYVGEADQATLDSRDRLALDLGTDKELQEAINDFVENEDRRNAIDSEVKRDRDRIRGPLKDAKASSEERGLTPDITKDARRISQQYNIPYDDALALAQEEEFKNRENDRDIFELAEANPVLATWGSTPENFPLLSKDPQGLKKVADAQSPFTEDLTNIIKSSVYDIRRSYIMISMLNGFMDREQAVSLLEAVDTEEASGPGLNYESDVQRINQTFQDLEVNFEALRQSFEKSQEMSPDDWSGFAIERAKVMLQAGMTTGAVMEAMFEMMKDPKAGVLFTAHAAKSGALSYITGGLGLGFGGLIGLASTGPVGAFPAAGTGFALGKAIGEGATAFSTRLIEEMNQRGFSKDYRRFFEDEAEFTKAKQKSLKYATYLSTLNFFITKYAGSNSINTLTRKKGLAQQAGAAVKDIATTASQEAGAEFTARVAPGVTAEGEAIEGEEFASAATEAVVEGVAGLASAPISVGLNTILDRAGNTFNDGNNDNNSSKTKMVEEIVGYYNRATETINRRDAYEKMRESIASLSVRDNIEQVKDLIRSKIRKSDNPTADRNRQNLEDDLDLASEQDLDETSEQLIKDEEVISEEYADTLTNRDETDTNIYIDPQDWIDFFVQRGKDPYTEIAKINPDMQTVLADADIDGNDIAIPFEDFITTFADDTDVSEIVKFGNDEISAREAQANIKEIDGKLPELFQPDDPDNENKGPNFINPIEDPQQEDPVLRQVELLNRYRSTNEQRVHEKLQKDITRIIKDTKIDNGVAPAIAEMQFQHLRQRSSATGISISDLSAQLEFRSASEIFTKEGGSALGQVTFKTPIDMTLKIVSYTDKPSTLLHELGHTWLYDMMLDWDHMHGLNTDEMTTEQAQYLEAMDIAAELLGYESLKDLQALGSNNTQEGRLAWKKAQETFAVTTEKYFLEGKFKNNRIQTLMEALRRFLAPFARVIGKAYQSIGIYPMEVNDQTERMFEGILGTSDQISEQLEPMFSEPDYDPAIFGAKADEYRQAQLDARDEAVGEFVSKITLRSYKEREALINKELARFRREAIGEVEFVPAVVLANNLKAAPAGTKISTEDFIATYGEEAVSQIPRGILSGKKKKGIPVTDAMAGSQFGDFQIFLSMLRQANNKDLLIDLIVQQKIQDQFPNVKNDVEIHFEAVDALQNKGKRKIMRMERDKLLEERQTVYKNIGEKVALPARFQNRMVARNVENEALGFALRETYIGYRAENLLKVSDRHGKNSAKLFRQGDIDGAIDEKFHQIVKFEAYKKALSIENQVRKTRALEKSVKKFSISKNAKRFDYRGMGFAKEVVKAFESGQPIPFINVAELNPELDSVFNKEWGNFINEQIGRINSELVDQIIRQNATAQTYLQYGDLLKILKRSSRNERRLFVEEQNLNANVVKQSVIDEITFLEGNPDGGRRSPLPPVKVTDEKGIRKFLTLASGDLLKMRDAFMSMYSSNEEFAQGNIAPIFNAVLNGESRMAVEEESFFNDLYKTFTKDVGQGNSNYEAFIAPFVKRAKEFAGKDLHQNIVLNEFDITVTKQELLGMLLHSGSESNLRHLLLGGVKDQVLAQYDPNTDSVDQNAIDKYWGMMDRLFDEGVITKSDLKGVELIWDFFRRNYDEVQKSFEHMYGYRFGKIEGRPVNIGGKSYKGGYFPLFNNDPLKDLDAETKSLLGNFGKNAANEMFPHTDISYSIKRSGYNQLKLELDILPYAVKRIMQMKHLNVPLYEFGKIIGDKEVSMALENRMPGIIKDIVTPWIQRTLAQKYSENGVGGRGYNLIANRIRRNARIHWFFGSLSTPAKQAVGLIQAVPQVKALGKEGLLESVLETTMNSPRYRELISEKSPVMKARIEGGQRRVLRHYEDMNLDSDFVSNTDNFIQQATFYMIQMMQNQVDMAVWLTAYNQAVNTMTESQAIGHADNIVNLTQGSSMVSNRSAIEQTTETMKLLLTDFTTIPLAIRGQNVVAQNQNVDADRMAAYKRRAEVYLMSAMVPGLVMAAFGAGYSFLVNGEKDPEKLGQRFLLSTARDSIVPYAPVLGNIAVSAGYNFMNRRREEIQTSPALSMSRTVFNAGLGLYDELTGVNASPSDIESMFYASSLILGFPLSPLGSGVRIYEGNKSDRLKRREKAIRRQQMRERKAQ